MVIFLAHTACFINVMVTDGLKQMEKDRWSRCFRGEIDQLSEELDVGFEGGVVGDDSQTLGLTGGTVSLTPGQGRLEMLFLGHLHI